MRYNNDTHSIELDIDELCDQVSDGFASSSKYHPFSNRQSLKNQSKVRRDILRDARFEINVPLSFRCSLFGINFSADGIADGILIDRDSLSLHLLFFSKKRQPKSFIDKYIFPRLVCLALFACDKYGYDTVKTVVYVSDEATNKTTEDTAQYSKDFLRRTYMGYLSKIERKASVIMKHSINIKNSVEEMKFPYKSVRQGQKELIEECYRTVHKGSRLFAQAPTGIGKTISTLYPSAKALGKGLCDKIFYLTAKASTRREAFNAVKRMHDSGAEIRAIILSAKETMCQNDQAKLSGNSLGRYCNPDMCRFAKSHSVNSDTAVFELLKEKSGFTPSVIKEKAKEYGICPYELSLDLSENCEIIICDYNYVFNPCVYLRRYFDQRREKYVFLIDEAHNLADRARDIYSACVSLREIENLSLQIEKHDSKIRTNLEELSSLMLGLRTLCSDNLIKDENGLERGFYISVEPISGFNEKLSALVKSCTSWLKNNQEHSMYNDINDVLTKISYYTEILEYYDEKFRTYITVEGGDITIRLFCLAPSHILDVCMNRARACVLFSATLTPTDYFADVLGKGTDFSELSLPSPFDSSNLCLCVASYISTRYQDRNTYAGKIASCIAASVLSKKGNYMVYFPSYSYLETVAGIFRKRYPKVNLTIQTKNMTNAERESFLDNFKNDTDTLRIGFCVLGGSFSEGVDLPGSRLIGSIIVGVGLPQLSNELNIIREFYDAKCERGYDYAYTYPGMNKVLQACGRVIRKEDDCGIVVLIDDRYATPGYLSLFPRHWTDVNFAFSAAELAKTIDDFWRNKNNV